MQRLSTKHENRDSQVFDVAAVSGNRWKLTIPSEKLGLQ